MPFFSDQQKIRNKKNVTLQVRMPNTIDLGKRVLSAVFMKRRASMSVEAACTLSLFLFFMITLLSPLKIMNLHRQMQSALETIGEDAAKYAYAAHRMEQGEAEFGNEESWKREFISSFANRTALLAYGSSVLKERFKNSPASRISLQIIDSWGDENEISLVVTYRVRLPFSLFGIDSLPQECRCRRRAWTGKDGGSGKSQGGEETEEIVYVGKGSVRYHTDRNCHYLYNDIKAVPLEGIDALRNAQGAIYHACSVCGGWGNSGIVYVMPNGSKYHTDSECSSIIAYVKSVRRSEVEYMGACSYCSGGGS